MRGSSHISLSLSLPSFGFSVRASDEFTSVNFLQLTEIAIVSSDDYVDDNTVHCGGPSKEGAYFGECEYKVRP